MHWILQEEIFSEAGWTALVETVERFRLPHSVHKVVPFVGELVPEPQLDHANVICCGSYSMRHVARQDGWTPGVFDLGENDFGLQLQHWGGHMLNAASAVSTLRDAVFSADKMFVRPADDSKYFAGRVFTRAEFEPWRDSVCRLELDYENSLRPDTLIQIAVPATIYAEYRFWIVKGRIVTKSMYKRGDRVFYSSDVDERLDEYVRERIAEWVPIETFVMDVCDTPNGVRIVEINNLNSAGFYAANVPALVLALEESYNTQV